jgi:hypothetical protein
MWLYFTISQAEEYFTVNGSLERQTKVSSYLVEIATKSSKLIQYNFA